MRPVLIAGTILVNLALVTYSVGIVIEQRRHRITRPVLWFLFIGVLLDIIATYCMIQGTAGSLISTHGFLGYSSLAGMMIETALAWRHRYRHQEETVSRRLHLYSRYAYIWWLVAYITGGLLVLVRRLN